MADGGPHSKGQNRDSRGRWLPGHREPGPGNPGLKRLSEIMGGVRRACSAKKVVRMLDRLYELGMAGDHGAIKTWLSYSIGTPAPVQVTGERDLAEMAEAMCEFLRAAWRRTTGDAHQEETGGENTGGQNADGIEPAGGGS